MIVTSRLKKVCIVIVGYIAKFREDVIHYQGDDVTDVEEEIYLVNTDSDIIFDVLRITFPDGPLPITLKVFFTGRCHLVIIPWWRCLYAFYILHSCVIISYILHLTFPCSVRTTN